MMNYMTSMKKPMNSPLTRRFFMAGASAGVLLTGSPLWAFSTSQAKDLIENVVRDINRIINSGKSEAVMLRDFEKIFRDYADVARIGQLVLGPPGRSASGAQRAAFASAFQIYISHKYGRRFREFIGGRVDVDSAKAVKSFYEVTTTTHMAGEAPFEVKFVVADKNGRFIDMKIEGISLVKAERTEIGAMLDKRKGNLNQLIKDLKNTR